MKSVKGQQGGEEFLGMKVQWRALRRGSGKCLGMKGHARRAVGGSESGGGRGRPQGALGSRARAPKGGWGEWASGHRGARKWRRSGRYCSTRSHWRVKLLVLGSLAGGECFRGRADEGAAAACGHAVTRSHHPLTVALAIRLLLAAAQLRRSHIGALGG